MIWPDIQAALGSFATKLELASRALSWAGCDAVGSNHHLDCSSSPFPLINGCLRWNHFCFQQDDNKNHHYSAMVLANRNATYKFAIHAADSLLDLLVPQGVFDT